MKILSKADFLKMPPGTIFSVYQPCIFNGFSVKGNSIDDIGDFTEAGLIGNPWNDSSDDYVAQCSRMELGESVPIDVSYFGREGMFDDKMLYAVYEKEDIVKIMKVLVDAL